MSQTSHSAPLSPHLQIWSWTVTMASSILHRATGIALYAGTFFLTVWIGAAALGPETYATVMGLFGSIFGKLILFGFTWAISFHLLNGLRYLFWDAGIGFEKSTAGKTGWAAIAGSVILTALIWGGVIMTGGV